MRARARADAALAAAALVAAAGLAACTSEATIEAADVVRLLPPDPATLVADGAASTTVEVATVPDDVKDGLKARLTLTGATWSGVASPGTVLDVELGPDGAARVPLVASRVPGAAVVVAEVAGYQSAPLTIPLTAAEVGDLASVTTGRLTPGTASTVQVKVQPLVSAPARGLPSAGTQVRFAVTSTPAGTAYATAPLVVMDATATTAETTVMAGATTSSVTVEVAITPPGAPSPTVTRTLTIAPTP